MNRAVLSVSDVEVGQALPPLAIHISRENLVQYTGASLDRNRICLLYTSPSPRDGLLSRMPSSA